MLSLPPKIDVETTMNQGLVVVVAAKTKAKNNRNE